MTGISAGKTWSRIGPEVAPTSSSASGVWLLNEVAENEGAGTWPEPPAGVFECIAKQTVSGASTTSVEFTSIPSSTYDNIEVIIAWVPATSNSASGISWTFEMEINGQTGNNYGQTWIKAQAASTDTSVTQSGNIYAATQPFYMGYTNYQNGYFNRQRWSNVNAATNSLGHTLSGGGIPGQPIGPSGATTYVFDRYGMGSGSTSAMTSLKFVSEWSRVIEAGTTFTMFGIKSS